MDSTALSKPTARGYLRLLIADWASVVSGGLSVPFTCLALVVDNRYAKVLFVVLAFLGLLYAGYRLWANERLRHIQIEQEEISAYRETLQGYRDGQQLDQPTIRRLYAAGLIDVHDATNMDTPHGEREYLPTGMTLKGMLILDGRLPSADIKSQTAQEELVRLQRENWQAAVLKTQERQDERVLHCVKQHFEELTRAGMLPASTAIVFQKDWTKNTGRQLGIDAHAVRESLDRLRAAEKLNSLNW